MCACAVLGVLTAPLSKAAWEGLKMASGLSWDAGGRPMEGCHNFLFICRPATTWVDLPKFSSSSACIFLSNLRI